MKEHPIPQDVTGYKFHIVGNMTLKQFAQVGAGVLLAVIIYNTNLIFPIKWLLIILSAGLGSMMAFVPIEERPLDHWIITFFKRLYSPTKFYWRKETNVPFAMQPKKSEDVSKSSEETFEIDLTPARTERIRQYLESVKQPTALEPWENEENSRVAQILDTFENVEVKNIESKPQKIRPQLTPRIRKLAANQKPRTQQKTIFQSSSLTEKQSLEKTTGQPIKKITETKLPEVEPIISNEIDQFADRPTQQIDTVPIDNSMSAADLASADITSNADTTSDNQTPVNLKHIKTEKPPVPVEVFADDKPIDNSFETPMANQPKNKVSTNSSLPFPQKELAPNKIVGMVLTKDNKLVDRAVVTIKDAKGKVAGAFNTNLLGQFFASTPFPNGTYIISVEKSGLQFPPASLVLNGSVIEPLELRAA